MQIGIIGGGQLAMMLCEAATKLGHQTVVLDPNPQCSASYRADELIVCEYDDLKGLEQLAASCSVVTYEFENVSIEGIDLINSKYNNVVQTSLPLKLGSDRVIEKQAALDSGFAPAPFKAIETIADVEAFICEHQYPVVIKTRRFGYDGKGQLVIRNITDLLLAEAKQIISSGAIVEKLIDLDYELSVVAIRNLEGQVEFIPSTINTHINNILFTSITDSERDLSAITKLVEQYLDYYNLIGIITVEVFVDKKGHIYFNEIAPRPHNSGHYSIEGTTASQFEMHIQCILNQALPKSQLVDKTMMINILGQDYQFSKQWFETNNCDQLYYHDYFKQEPKNNRKMAHITAVGQQAIDTLTKFSQVIKERNE